MIKQVETGAVVVNWDFSANSRVALEKALEIAGDSPVRVVHVARPLSGPDNGVLYDIAEKRQCRELRIKFQRQLTEAEKSQKIVFHVEYGQVHSTLVRFAERYQASAIVLSESRRAGIAKLLFGGLGERVAKTAPCPVHVMGQEGATDGAEDPAMGHRRSVVHN